MISWAEGVKKSLAGEGGRYTLAEKRRIDKALDLYLRAAEAAEKINNAEDVISHLKPYLHGLNLTYLKGEIKHKYDTKANGVMLMWGTKCDSRSTQASKEKDHRFGWSFSLVLLRELESRTP